MITPDALEVNDVFKAIASKFVTAITIVWPAMCALMAVAEPDVDRMPTAQLQAKSAELVSADVRQDSLQEDQTVVSMLMNAKDNRLAIRRPFVPTLPALSDAPVVKEL